MTQSSSPEIVTDGAADFTSTSPLVSCGVSVRLRSASDDAPADCTPFVVTRPTSTPARRHASNVPSASVAGRGAPSGTVAVPVALVVTLAFAATSVPATASGSPRRMMALAGPPSTVTEVPPAPTAPLTAIGICLGSLRWRRSTAPADGFTTSHEASALRSAPSVTRLASIDGTATVIDCTTRLRAARPDGDGTSAGNAPSAVSQSAAKPPTTSPSTLATCTALSLARLSVMATGNPSLGRSHQPFT